MMKLYFYFLFAIIFNSNNAFNLKSAAAFNENMQKYKMLFMLNLPTVKNDQSHPLNVLNYKNVLLSANQMVFFISADPSYSVYSIYNLTVAIG
jgi:hypothetical protein